MKTEKLKFGIISFFVILLFTNLAFCQQIDQKKIKAGILVNSEFTTIRAQSFSGHWRAQLVPLPASETPDLDRGEEKSMKPESELIAEGEDIAINLTRKGILGKISTGKEKNAGYEKIVFKGGELLNLEIPGESPILVQGEAEIYIRELSLGISNKISFRQFLVSSVSKFGISSEIEALKAYIVMARTRLEYLKNHPPHSDQNYEICDKDHCLSFRGTGQNRELVDILVGMTANKTMEYKGKNFFPRFHHTCGGKTASAKDILNKNEPYHVIIDDRIEGKGSENCFHSPGFHWSIELSKRDLLDFIAFSWAGGATRVFTGWEPLKIDSTGRTTRVLLRGRRPKEVDGLEFFEKAHEYFGPNSLKSMRFSMEVLRRSVIFRGMGKGIGLGMCLYGADGLAKKGKKFNEILEFYYPGINIK
jgi:stage II sporulation protein D